ncbi:MAG: hypothetical protein KBI10_09500 [Syntrophorhabdales bacterium]|nr:hypothetical protein [Syntrophorhabdales bacterium]
MQKTSTGLGLKVLYILYGIPVRQGCHVWPLLGYCTALQATCNILEPGGIS